VIYKESICENHKKDNVKTDYYSKGTNTPHFLFNFIDYLFWVESKKESFKFDFRYRNSVEHHLPQSFESNNF